ncbi:ADP-ribose pyrophosphatase YjhB, NUDIX family [Filimonas lacunae]|uniref:ADP-ribose pyrophosphatase YjhB, NUDIX family n=1 Tax=Filimonas lacunae TaxID=477680 RepID=A0A173MGI2_9BACT|nr:NUDIX domain-containing protein [Filimonas lacunae]BAV06528.1 bis(5'-nucleosyl)-tetraphosphatase, asymmetrical [Filimonas lacunae]SIT27271.1 ADP-ribose pyrophosphatase YjhB, NUDIX family [Filimonas lacunae]
MKKIIAAGGLVLNENAELLMIYRRGTWDLPKGKLDEGETIAACAVREVQEETGLKQVILGEGLGITIHTYTAYGEEILKETHWYKMEAPGSQVLVPQTEEDIEKIEWVNKTDLNSRLQNTYPNIADIVTRSGLIAAQ